MKDKLKSLLFGSKTVGALILRCIIVLIIPYAYLMLCGLIFDTLLKWYFMTTFIFFSMLALFVAAIVIIVSMIGNFINRGKVEVTEKAVVSKEKHSSKKEKEDKEADKEDITHIESEDILKE